MSREYCFNLAVPLEDVGDLEELLGQAQGACKPRRISRKPDRHGCARFYLSFPFSESRPDLKFQQWLADHLKSDWELFGPEPGRWGLS
jgi:hypothetical protein